MKDDFYAFPHLEQRGMTLRDYFAAAALPGAMELVRMVGAKEGMSAAGRASAMAYEQADAMLKERTK